MKFYQTNAILVLYRHLDDESVPSISGDYYLSSTPLNESLVAMDHVIKKFKTDYKTDKVALVTLTDGASNSMHHPKSGELHLKLNGRYVPAHSPTARGPLIPIYS